MLISRWYSVCYDQHQPWYIPKHAYSNCPSNNNCPRLTNCHWTVIDDNYSYYSGCFESWQHEHRQRRRLAIKKHCFAEQDNFSMDWGIACADCREFIGILSNDFLRTSDNRAYFTILIQNPLVRSSFYSLLVNTRFNTLWDNVRRLVEASPMTTVL
jgi:hypothetical protein